MFCLRLCCDVVWMLSFFINWLCLCLLGSFVKCVCVCQKDERMRKDDVALKWNFTNQLSQTPGCNDTWFEKWTKSLCRHTVLIKRTALPFFQKFREWATLECSPFRRSVGRWPRLADWPWWLDFVQLMNSEIHWLIRKKRKKNDKHTFKNDTITHLTDEASSSPDSAQQRRVSRVKVKEKGDHHQRHVNQQKDLQVVHKVGVVIAFGNHFRADDVPWSSTISSIASCCCWCWSIDGEIKYLVIKVVILLLVVHFFTVIILSMVENGPKNGSTARVHWAAEVLEATLRWGAAHF